MTDFVTVANSLARDSRLSYRARGVLIEILSHESTWAPDPVEMSLRGKEGRDAIYTSFKELEDAGYLVRERVRDANGHWSTRSVFYASPQVAPITDSQEPVPPRQTHVSPARTDYGFSGTGDATLLPAETRIPAGRTDYGFPGIGFPGINNEELNEELQLPTPLSVAASPQRTSAATAPPNPSGRVAPADPPPTRLPADFRVTPELVAWCRRNFPAIDGAWETRRFIEYWQAVPGKRGEKKKWDRAWMNWIRKAAQFNGARSANGRSSGPKRSTTDERVIAGLLLAEKLEREDSTAMDAVRLIQGELL